jgi:hypothetical protein
MSDESSELILNRVIDIKKSQPNCLLCLGLLGIYQLQVVSLVPILLLLENVLVLVK